MGILARPVAGIRHPEPADASIVAARIAHLRHVSDRQSGITRERTARGFIYRSSQNVIIRDRNELARINAIAVPPAWTNVWICPHRNGHIQATGRDARGRKQYRYHGRWRMVRDQTKYQHMLVFARALPGIRQQVAADLARAGLPREKVIAAVVRLMEQTLARVGNLEYARQNDSFGLTTLKNHHVRLSRGRIELDFRAKSGLHHHSLVSDRKLAQILKRCRDLPGSELFQYIDDDGTRHVVNSEDVNDYLRSISGHEITAKDFRTWAATNLALKALRDLNETRPSKKGVLQMVGQVASQLGNTPAVCRKCYIHPAIIDTYLTGSLRLKWRVTNERTANGLWAIERELIRFLHKQRPQQPEPHSLKATLVKSLKSVKSRSAVGI